MDADAWFPTPAEARSYLGEVGRLWLGWIAGLAVLALLDGWVVVVGGVGLMILVVWLIRPLRARAERMVPEGSLPVGAVALAGWGDARERMLQRLAYGAEPLTAAVEVAGAGRWWLAARWGVFAGTIGLVGAVLVAVAGVGMTSPASAAAAVESLASLLASSSRVLVFTGAGVSTASGLPDYRGPQGVWNTQRPIDYAEFMGSVDARRRSWQQKMDGWDRFSAVEPNATHHAVVDLERVGMIEAVVTQNVDGLHAAAGTSPELLVELHGTGRLIACQSCGERTDPEPHFEAFRSTGEPPSCRCGGILKSATISFGQSLDRGDLARAAAAAERCDLVVALGSTLSVYPAADIPLTAAASGAPYVIVNRGPTEHDRQPLLSLRIEGDVTEVVPAAVRAALA